MTEMRRLLGVLREDEASYIPQPGIARLPELLEEARSGGLEVELAEEGERPQLSPGLDLTVYRLVQEALTNARKHAGSARARARRLQSRQRPRAAVGGRPRPGRHAGAGSALRRDVRRRS
jgi:signal transduction histidine kinase